MLNTTRLIKINKRSLFTNLRSNQLYSKEQLVNDLQVLTDEIQKRTEKVFFVKLKTTPYLQIDLTSYKEFDKDDASKKT